MKKTVKIKLKERSRKSRRAKQQRHREWLNRKVKGNPELAFAWGLGPDPKPPKVVDLMAKEADEGVMPVESVSMFICGGPCKADGQEHTWDGPLYEDETTSSTTCSKCGMRQIDYDMMCGP